MNCKVIATCFSEGRVQTDARFPNHNQDIETKQGKLDMLKQIVWYEIHKNEAGVPLDILIVNPDVGFVEGNEWLKTINGIRTLEGHIYTITRENIGGSFGSYSDAFLKFKDSYEYWLFTEDDIVVGGREYYRRIFNKFRARKNAGFIALIGLSRHPLGTHAHGGIGLTSREVLSNIVKNNNGELPHFKGSWDKDKVIAEGEVRFTNFIEQKIGKDIIPFCDLDEWDLEKKLCIPYYNFTEIH